MRATKFPNKTATARARLSFSIKVGSVINAIRELRADFTVDTENIFSEVVRRSKG